MNNSNTEEFEFDQLSQKLMLNLKSIKEHDEMNEIKDMVIDYHQDSFLNEISYSDISNKENIPSLINNYHLEQDTLIDKKKLPLHSISIQNQLLNRSSSLPPKNYQGLNLFTKKIDSKFLDHFNKTPINNNNNTINSTNMDSNANNNNNTINNHIKNDHYLFKDKQLIYIRNTQAITSLIFNIILILTTLYIIFAAIFVIKNDIESKIQISITNIIEDINICSKQYIDNKCQPDQRVPAMEIKCNEWEKCMSQNPTIIARKSIFTAQIIGEIINTFLDQISFKSALFIFGFILALIIGNFFVIKSSIFNIYDKGNQKNYVCY